MINRILLALVVVLIAACSSRPADDYGATGDKRLRTTAPSRLYFSNIRQIDYRQAPTEVGAPDRFSWRRWPESADLELVIANHWLTDEAYLEWLPAKDLPLGKDSLRLLISHSGKSKTFVLATQSRVKAYEAGVLLYDALVNNGRLAFLPEGQPADTLRVWEDAASRRAAVVVLSDYFRLVERKGF